MTTKLDKYPNRIREVREGLGLTQAELGSRVGFSAIHIGHVELGRRKIKLDVMRLIATAMGVSVTDLLTDEDSKCALMQSSNELLTTHTASHITTDY